MSDYCYVEVTVSEEDKDIAINTIKDYNEITHNNDGTINIIVYKGDYGLADELQKLANNGVNFVYSHEAGGNYGPCVGACVNGEIVECNADFDGNPVVTFPPTYQISQKEIDICKKYYSTLKKFYNIVKQRRSGGIR